jgi:hypothetical protein
MSQSLHKNSTYPAVMVRAKYVTSGLGMCYVIQKQRLVILYSCYNDTQTMPHSRTYIRIYLFNIAVNILITHLLHLLL